MTHSQRVIIVDFWFVHLKWNKFETSPSFVKSYLIEHHLLFDNKSKDILNAFNLVLMRNCFEMDMRKFVEKFEYISILNSQVFYKNKYVLDLLFASMIENV